jgi:hypothetical protein
VGEPADGAPHRTEKKAAATNSPAWPARRARRCPLVALTTELGVTSFFLTSIVDSIERSVTPMMIPKADIDQFANGRQSG